MISAKKIEPTMARLQWKAVKPSTRASNSRATRICQPIVSETAMTTRKVVSVIGTEMRRAGAIHASVRLLPYGFIR